MLRDVRCFLFALAIVLGSTDTPTFAGPALSVQSEPFSLCFSLEDLDLGLPAYFVHTTNQLGSYFRMSPSVLSPEVLQCPSLSSSKLFLRNSTTPHSSLSCIDHNSLNFIGEISLDFTLFLSARGLATALISRTLSLCSSVNLILSPLSFPPKCSDCAICDYENWECLDLPRSLSGCLPGCATCTAST